MQCTRLWVTLRLYGLGAVSETVDAVSVVLYLSVCVLCGLHKQCVCKRGSTMHARVEVERASEPGASGKGGSSRARREWSQITDSSWPEE